MHSEFLNTSGKDISLSFDVVRRTQQNPLIYEWEPVWRWASIVAVVSLQIANLIDYCKWLLSFIDDGKFIPPAEKDIVSHTMHT